MSDEQGRRPLLNRIGIVLLNLPVAPGLGLLRAQRLRAATMLLLLPHIVLGLIILIFATAPTLGFWAWAGIALAGLAITLVGWIVAMVMSWRASRAVQASGPWWSHWYAILGVFAVSFAIAWVETDLARSWYKVFYLRSSSMSPTLMPNDRLLASMRGPGEWQRGDVVLIETDRDVIYVSRIAALPEDRIELIDGVVVINGRQVGQQLVRMDPLPPGDSGLDAREARRLTEQFPGEAAAHEIYDIGYTAADDHGPVLVPPGHIFALGDNRDNAADSRISRSRMGLELVPLERVRGRALSYGWGSSRPMGTPLGPR